MKSVSPVAIKNSFTQSASLHRFSALQVLDMNPKLDTSVKPGAGCSNTKPGAGMLVVIDAAVEDYQMLVDGVLEGAEVVVLHPQQDGVEQITLALKQHPHITSLHIVSHGSPGSVQLGNTYLSLNTLERYSWDLQSWFASSGADLLLYGCNVAAESSGILFLEQLHQLTGANIAASTNKTGNAEQGGDWELEVTIGNICSSVAFQSSVLGTYKFTLGGSDSFAGRTVLTGFSGDIGSSVGATGEPGEPTYHAYSWWGDGLNSVWWSWTAPVSIPIEINLIGSNYDTVLAVYTGSSLNQLTLVRVNDDYYGLQSRAAFNATAGTTYQIAVDGFGSGTGSIVLNLQPYNITTNTVQGTSNVDSNLRGTNIGDSINGLENNDTLFGLDGADNLYGGLGNDTLRGGNQNDVLYGNDGNDSLFGDAGNDILLGGIGNDILRGGDNNDILEGEAGTDSLFGDAGDDILNGGTDNDTLRGGDGNDRLTGGSGTDSLFGDAGDDLINGGAGADSLTGGSGNDTFVLTRGEGADTITDFVIGQDKIQLQGVAYSEIKFTQSGTSTLLQVGTQTLATLNQVNRAALMLSDSFVTVQGSFSSQSPQL